MRRTKSGWFLTVSGVFACPCHLAVTLPFAVALLTATALGTWIAAHEGIIASAATIYFIAALGAGMLLLIRPHTSPRGQQCALPNTENHKAAALSDERRTGIAE